MDEWIILHKYDGTPINVRRVSVNACKYNRVYDYTDVYLSGGQLLEVKESCEEILSLVDETEVSKKKED